MAREVQRAVTGEIPTPKFSSNLMDTDREPSCKKVGPEAPYCFVSSYV